MTESLLPIEAHAKWLHAFNWWYHSADLDLIITNLREGVPLSTKNSRYLAVILDGSEKPLTGKQAGLSRFKSNIIDNTIHDLRNQGTPREQILEQLKKKGLMKEHVAITAVHRRIDRSSTNPMQRHAELDKQFAERYDAVTGKI